MNSRISGQHLNGYKHLSINEPIKNLLDVDKVYFPIKYDNNVFNLLVEVGQNVLLGQPLLEKTGRFIYPVNSSVSGTVTGIKKMWHSSGKMVEMLEITNDHLDTLFYNLQNNLDKSKDEQIELIKQAGIVGLGGAGFPTFVKFSAKESVDAFIVNAAECEPYITCDYMSIIENADKLIRGLSYAMNINNASFGYIAIKKNKKPAIEALNKAISNLNAKNISVYLLNDVYPAGWEKYIVEHILKKTYQGLPREAGAIVDNVQTVMAICDVLETNQPLTKRVVTLTGDGIKNPKNYLVRIGTNISNLVNASNGYVDDLGDAYFIAGGPMTGRAMIFDDLIITPNVGSAIIKKKMIGKEYPCIGCGKCSEHCPTFLTPTAIKQAFLDKDVELLKKLDVTKCVQCGLCSYVCPSRVEMTDYMAKAKDLVLRSIKR